MEDFYKDIFEDAKNQRKFYSRILISLIVIIAILITGIIYLSHNNQRLLKEMSAECNEKIAAILSDADFITEYEIVTDNHSLNNGNITNTR